MKPAASAAPATAEDIPPEVKDAEARLMAELLSGHAGKVLEHLRPQWLCQSRHRRIYERAAALHAAQEPVDLVTLCADAPHEEMIYASELIGRALGGANIEPLARCLDRYWRRSETQAIGRQLSNGASRDPEQVRTLMAQLSDLNEPVAQDGLADLATGAGALTHATITRPPSLFGNGLMSPGDLGILYAKPRLGKTWLALLLGRAIARGEPWLGLPTTQGRVGMIGMETPDYVIQERYRAIASEDGVDERDDNFQIVARNKVKDRLDLLNDDHWAKIRTLCVRGRLDLLILDALSRFHTVDEIAANEMGKVLGRVDDLRAKTGTAILLLHHEPKGVQGQEFSDDLDALRGSTRLASDPTFAARLVRFKNTPLTQLRFPKVSFGMEPDPIFLTTRWDGVPVVRKAPEAVGDENRSKVRHQLELYGAQGISMKQLCENCSLRKSAVAQHLGALGSLQFRSGKEVLWMLPSASGQQLEAPETSRDATDYTSQEGR